MRPQTLLGQIVISAGSAVVAFVAIWSAAVVLWLYSAAVFDLETEADRQSRELSTALASLLWNLDQPSIQTLIETKATNLEFTSLVVRDTTGGREWSPPHFPRHDKAPKTSRTVPIVYAEKEIGSVFLELTMGPRQKKVTDLIVTLISSLLLLFLAIMASVTLTWRRVAARLKAMVRAQEEFSNRGGEARMVPGRNDELGILAQGFNTMADRIQAATRSMEQEIQERTDRLMESEKLALVGSLVAGVAHEINTPIGNGITVTSWLASRTREIQGARRGSSLSDEVLGDYLADVESSLGILQSGLDRTSNLIQSFKTIGTDQVVDERRVLFVESFLEEVVTSLQPTLKRFPHKIEVSCARDFTIENHPGTLFQIVTNLVLNAHHHAFGPQQAGTITLRADLLPDSEWFLLSVKDDGAGIPPELLGRIFQPFFTTKRMEGGTGLGLSIVHNLVLNLGGAIEVTSTPGEGSEFLVTLPRRAPDRPAVVHR